jgi:hypothetical protein
MPKGIFDNKLDIGPGRIRRIIRALAFRGDVVAAAVDELITEFSATRVHHVPTITPDSGRGSQEPDLAILGSVLVANYTIGVDRAYRVFKIPNNFAGNAAFHVHWTKEEGVNGDTDESGNNVRWRLSYTVFQGGGTDINVAPTVLDIDDTYEDSGTTTRITYRTANTPASGFLPNYYVGISIEAAAPEAPALSCEPALISADLTFDAYTNLVA